MSPAPSQALNDNKELGRFGAAKPDCNIKAGLSPDLTGLQIWGPYSVVVGLSLLCELQQVADRAAVISTSCLHPLDSPTTLGCETRVDTTAIQRVLPLLFDTMQHGLLQ